MPAKKKKLHTHSSGLLRSRVTVGHDSQGKPVRKPVYAHSVGELKEKVAQVRIESGMGVSESHDKSTFKYWASAWKALTQPTVEAATWANYETALKHLSPLYSQRMSKITSVDIEALIAQKFSDGYSKRTLSLILDTASRVFRLAKKNRAILFNPADDVSVPKSAPASEREAISNEIQEKLKEVEPLSASNNSEKLRGEKFILIKMFALMQLNCGLRRGEAAALEWKNVDIRAGTVHVEQSYNFKEKRIKPPKSKAGYRTIPIPDDYLNSLKGWKSRISGSLAGRRFVFPYREKIITQTSFKNLWDILLDTMNGISLSDRIRDGVQCSKKRKNDGKAKLPKGRRHKMYREIYFTSHQLRHTFATNMIACGVDVRSAQYFMGHSTPQMTMEYTHISQSALLDAREKMNGFSSKQSNSNNNCKKSGLV